MVSSRPLGRFIVTEGSTFRITLHISHPSIPAAEIEEAFGLETRFSQSVGEQKKTKNGKELDGNYKLTNVSFRLHDLPMSFTTTSVDTFIIERLESHDPEYICSLVKSGGSCNLLLGVYSGENVMFELSNQTIRLLATANISIKYDFYGGT